MLKTAHRKVSGFCVYHEFLSIASSGNIRNVLESMDIFQIQFHPVQNILIGSTGNVDIDMGDIMGDMNKRRGRILGMDTENGKQVITAEVPLDEMYKYCSDLRSMTQGRGKFEMDFERYEEVPVANQEKIIKEAKNA